MARAARHYDPEDRLDWLDADRLMIKRIGDLEAPKDVIDDLLRVRYLYWQAARPVDDLTGSWRCS